MEISSSFAHDWVPENGSIVTIPTILSDSKLLGDSSQKEIGMVMDATSYMFQLVALQVNRFILLTNIAIRISSVHNGSIYAFIAVHSGTFFFEERSKPIRRNTSNELRNRTFEAISFGEKFNCFML